MLKILGELNPCLNNQAPVFDTHTNTNLICNEPEDGTQTDINQCPAGHYCTGFDENKLGVCCPGKSHSLLLRIYWMLNYIKCCKLSY